MAIIHEAYRKIGDPDDRFDTAYWQAQGEKAIFDAAREMVLDYLILRDGHAEEPRIRRDIEAYGRI